MGHHHHHPQVPTNNGNDERAKASIRVTLIGSVIDLLLGVAKIFVGIIAQSQALIADGIHSLSDLFTDFIVIYAAKHAGQDADEEHPYGHGRYETVATVALGIALIAVAVGIAYDAIGRLMEPETIARPGLLALYVALISIIAKEAIYQYTMVVARKYNSRMLKANAWHSRTDAISSIVVVIGVGGSLMGFWYLDALAAIGVGFMVAKIGWELAWHSVKELVDTSLESERVEEIEQAIQQVDGVSELHLLRTRQMGADALVDVHIVVNPDISVSEGHQISEKVRHELIDVFPEVNDVMVHIDPEDDLEKEPCSHLPLREELLQILKNSWQGIRLAEHVEDVTLHYLDGKVDVQIILPLVKLASVEEANGIAKQFNDAISDCPDIRKVDVLFH